MALYRHKVEGQKIIPLFAGDNIQRLLGFTPVQVMSFEWWRQSLHPDDRDKMQAASATMMTGEGFSLEYRERHADGTYRWVLDNNRILRDTSPWYRQSPRWGNYG